MLEEAFSDFCDLLIVEEEREMHEGTSHVGMSALINLTARKPTHQLRSADDGDLPTGPRSERHFSYRAVPDDAIWDVCSLHTKISLKKFCIAIQER